MLHAISVHILQANFVRIIFHARALSLCFLKHLTGIHSCNIQSVHAGSTRAGALLGKNCCYVNFFGLIMPKKDTVSESEYAGKVSCKFLVNFHFNSFRALIISEETCLTNVTFVQSQDVLKLLNNSCISKVFSRCMVKFKHPLTLLKNQCFLVCSKSFCDHEVLDPSDRN